MTKFCINKPAGKFVMWMACRVSRPWNANDLKDPTTAELLQDKLLIKDVRKLLCIRFYASYEMWFSFLQSLHKLVQLTLSPHIVGQWRETSEIGWHKWHILWWYTFIQIKPLHSHFCTSRTENHKYSLYQLKAYNHLPHLSFKVMTWVACHYKQVSDYQQVLNLEWACEVSMILNLENLGGTHLKFCSNTLLLRFCTVHPSCWTLHLLNTISNRSCKKLCQYTITRSQQLQ